MTFCHLNEADSLAPSIFFSIYQDKKQKKDLEKMFSQESGFGIPWQYPKKCLRFFKQTKHFHEISKGFV